VCVPESTQGCHAQDLNPETPLPSSVVIVAHMLLQDVFKSMLEISVSEVVIVVAHVVAVLVFSFDVLKAVSVLF
jgi:hypothetical protein